MGGFLSALGASLGMGRSPTGGRGGDPRVLIPFPELGSVSRSLRESAEELPMPGRGHRTPLPKAVAAPKKKGLHSHPVSVSPNSRIHSGKGNDTFPALKEALEIARKSQTKIRFFLRRFSIHRLEKALKLPDTG